jgi:hypothetical protein
MGRDVAGQPPDGHLDEHAPVMKVDRWLLVAALLAATALTLPGITDENRVSLQGDMPRYLMNGVFIKDFLTDGSWSPANIMRFAEHYFARYPALSLGHHPPLLPMLLVPFFAVAGISVFSGKLAILLCFLGTVIVLYRVGARLFDPVVAGWACLLFATLPLTVEFGQAVLTELPATLLSLVALLYLLRFRDGGRLNDYLGFIAAALGSVFCRQTAAFMLPTYILVALRQGGYRQLLTPPAFYVTVAGAVGVAIVVVATLILSPYNVSVVGAMLFEEDMLDIWGSAVRALMGEHSAALLTVAAGLGIAAAFARRDFRVVPAAWWLVSVFVAAIFVTGDVAPARYSFMAMPAAALLVASLAAHSAGGVRTAFALGLAGMVASQTIESARVRPAGAAGYEAAAQYVLAEAPDRPVLYSATVDTGFFVFFTRKHDPAQRLITMRSDKLLTTSLMFDPAFAERIDSPDDIYPLLDEYGIRFVVLEDRVSQIEVLDWLRAEVHTDRFLERRRFPMQSRDPRLAGVSLSVYEYRDAKEPAADAVIDLDLPIVGRKIQVPLADLLAR